MASPTVDIGTLIVSTPGVTGGAARIAGTRIAVRAIAELHNAGESPDRIRERFPHVDLNAIYAAIAYYLSNKEAVDGELRDDEAYMAKVLSEHPEGWGPLTTPTQ